MRTRTPHWGVLNDESTTLAGVRVADTDTRIKIVKGSPSGSTITPQAGPFAEWTAFSQVRE